jgi:hypothetical protein
MPIESQYTVWVSTTATVIPPNCGLFANNASLFVFAPTTGYTYLNLTYIDPTLTTTNLTFFVNNPVGTQLYFKNFFGPPPMNQTVNTNWTVPNAAGMQYVWGYFANTTTCGNLTASQGITLKGVTGRLIELDPCKGYATGWDSTC